jgi:hypothetical protein
VIAEAARAFRIPVAALNIFELWPAVMLLPFKLLRTCQRLVAGGEKFSDDCVVPEMQLF